MIRPPQKLETTVHKNIIEASQPTTRERASWFFGWGMNWTRIRALLLRNLFVYRRTMTRLLDIFFWPFLELLLWGFIASFIGQTAGRGADIASILLGAVLLWEVFLRSALGTSTTFLEDLWTRNFLNIFAAPVTVGEFLMAILLSSLIRVAMTSVILALLASLFYGFNVLTLGLPLAAFYANLVMTGWGLGIIAMAIILRFGQSAEILAWAFSFLLQPFAAVFYPVSVLPHWLQYVAQAIPLSHVFEGMRGILLNHTVPYHELLWAFLLNAAFLLMATALFMRVFRIAKKKGFLVRVWQ